MALPAGFVLEEYSTASNLPPGFELEQPTTAKEKPGAFVSGFKSYAPQLQETYGGIKTLAGVAAERVLGAGDISKGLIASGGASMAEAQKAQEAISTPERSSFTDALSKGVGSVLTEWLPFQAGSGAANILESLAVVGAGALAGSTTAPGPGTVVGMGTGLVAKEIVKRGIKEAAEKILKESGEEASKAFFEQEARKAAAEVASRVGKAAALGTQAGFYGTGQATSRAVEEAERAGGTASDIELGRVLPAAVVSAGMEFIGDKIGLGALEGAAKPGAGYLANITKNILLAGTKEAPVEAIQSAAERYGAKLSLTDAAAIKEYIDSATAAYAMSVAPGTVGGIRGTIQQRAGEMAPGQLPGETVEQSIARLQQEIISAQQPPAPPAAAPVDIVGMASAPGGYAELEKLKQNLLSAEPTEENKRQIADIKDVQARMNIEQVSRMTPAAQTLEAALAEPVVPPIALPFNDLADVAQAGGWTDLFQYRNQLLDFVKQQTANKEVVQPEILTAIKDSQFILDKLSTEEYQRRPAGAVYESAFAPPPPPVTVVDDTTARKLGFVPSKSEKGIYNQIVNRDLTDPVQLTAVRQTLEQYVAKGTGGATTIAKVKSFLDTIPQGVKDVGTPVTTPSGAGPTVVSEPGAGSAAAGVGGTEPSGVVPPEQDVGVSDVGEGRSPVAVEAPIAPVAAASAPVTELIAPVTPITSAPIAPVAEVSAPVAPIAPPPSQKQVPQSDLSGTAVGGAPDVVPFTTKPPGVGPAITEQQDYEQAIVQANKAARAVERKSKSLWGRLRGVLPMQDVNDISPDRKFRMLGNVRQGMSLSTLVADGAVDEFLPPDMRHDVDTFDEYDSTEYIKDRLREGSYLTFDAQAEIRQIGSTIAELEDALDAHLKEKEVNELIQEAIDEQEGTVSEIEAIEPSDEAAVAGTVPTEQAAPAVTEEPAAPVQFKIVKTEVSDDAGGSKTAWNVTDKADGYIFDTFDTRKEAQDHVNRNKAPKKSLAGVSEKRLQELDRRAKAARKAPAKAPEVVTQQTSPEVQAKIKQLEGLLKKLMSRFGLQDVGLNLVNDLAANGEYSNNLIKLAIDAINPVRDIRHESLHALKALGFFTDQQWSVLEKKAKDSWINEFLKQRNINGEPLQTGEKSRYDAYVEMFNSQGQTQEYIDEALIEEAISDAFGSFDVNKAPSGMIQAVLKRMKTFFAVIKEALGQAKIETAEDIFEKAEAGKLKGAAKPEAKEAKASLRAPQTEAFKRWFGDSKVVDENGEPLVVYHKSYDDFTEFSSEKIGSNDYGYAGRGFYFMDIPLQGLTYGDRTMPVYLSLQNPYIRTAKNWKTDKLNPYSWIADNLDKYGSRAQASEAWTQMMKDKGYDGFIDRADSSGGELVAFYPTQIKSAIGNIGAYSLTNPDIRKSLRAPDTRAFKQWFGNSKIVNEDGTPKVMYHGTARDISEFTPKQAGAIFVTENPEFADVFTKTSASWMAKHADQFLTPKQIDAGKKAAAKTIKKDYAADPSLAEKIVAAIDNPNSLYRTEALEELAKQYQDQMPTGPNVMPVFIKAENPFDYDKKAHIDKLEKYAKENEYSPRDITNDIGSAIKGNWEVIESSRFQNALKSLGFDSFYVREFGQKNLAVYSPTQIKSATGNIGTYDITSPDIRYSLRDKLGMYSELENKIEAGSNKAPAASWKSYINGLTQKGVKPEEIEWSGVNDWLDLQKGTVTKNELLTYLKQGGVKVEETVLGGERRNENVEVLANGDGTFSIIDTESGDQIGEDYDTEEQANEVAFQTRTDGTKYSAYTLPGGENYREVLLTLPQQEIRTEDFVTIGANGKPFDVHATEEEARQVAKRIGGTYEPGTTVRREKSKFQSSHWDEANVIAHIRLNDRTDTDGSKVLFVEELQSDWGQEGKKKGFADPDSPVYAVFSKSGYFLKSFEDKADAEAFAETVSGEVRAEKRQPGDDSRPPAAPFVTKTEGWLNLALKRIMVMAAEGGYDKVAFVNGEQSAERYDLSKQVDAVRLTSDGDLLAKKSGAWSEVALGVNQNKLADYIGKEAASKLLEQSPDKGGDRTLSGLDLKVGGEGMKTFYDQIVPMAVKKLLPKVGGGQMSEATIVLNDNIRSRVAPADAGGVEDDGRGFWLGSKGKAWDNQPGFDVTPSMKQKVETTGLPRFSIREKQSVRSRATPSMMRAIERVTTARDELTFVERITKAIAPETFSKFRAQALNRYNQLSVYDKMVAQKMGGIQLMADRSAESAALMSDLGAGVVAAAMGVHDRVGGIPVYKNGFTTISTQKGTVKGVIAIFAPLAKYNDPDIYRAFQFWAGSKRGSRFLANGTEHLYTQADLQEANKVLAMYPEFTQIFKEWTKYNEGLVQYMVDTGVISAANGKHFIAHSDYLPFYRQIDGENTVGPNIFQSISGVKAPRKIKGGEAPLADFLETIVRNTQASIQAGLKNVAAQRAVNQAVAIGEASRLPTVASGLSVVTILENGLKVSYDCNDPLFIDAVKSLNLPDLPFLGILAGPANLLRNLVTKDPGFMLVNLMRDSMSAYVTSGVKMVPIVATAKNFATALAGKSPEYMALLNAGVLGGYDYSAGVETSAKQLAKELRKSAGVETKAEKFMKPATWLWEALEKGTQASDAATRIEVYKKTLAETNNEAEALFRSLEVMNFNRKGSSAVIRIATAAIPFLNARMQGLDILYRSGISPRFDKNATTREKAIQKTFFVRGATIAALSCMYWMLTHDDEEYEKQEQETKDNFWLFPSLGIKIAIPFEVGIIFKVIPERIMAYSFGNDTGKDFMASMKRNLQNTMPITLTGMIPQVAKPYLESQMNYSLFTNRAIISQGMENVAPEFQALPATGTIFKDLGEQLGVSPIKLEYMWKGYTGTMGTYLADAIDSVYNLHKDAPKAAKRFEQLPVIKRFAVDPDARGSVTAFYDLKNATDTVVKTSNLLERSQNPEAYAKYVQENIGILASKDYVQEVYNTLMEFSGYKEMIRNTEMDPKEKRDLLLSITRIENHLTSNVQTVRKAAGL